MAAEQADAIVERPKTYADLQARPDFHPSLDQRAHALDRVLSDYHFPNNVPCGLSTCHRAHQTGFLVRTRSGLETAIGHICGRNIFGEEVWDLAAAKYVRERKRLDLLARAQEIQSSASSIDQAVEAVMADRFGVRWVRDVRQAFTTLLGDGLCDDLRIAHKRRSLDVTQARERSAADMDRLAEANKRHREAFRTETIVVGHLSSAEWLAFEFTRTLRDELQAELKDFLGVNPALLPTPSLRQRLKKFDGWEKRISDARAAARTAVEFLDEGNLGLLVWWIPDRLEARRQTLRLWIGSAAHTALLQGRS